MGRWAKLIDTYNKKTSRRLVEILVRKGYNADFNTSKAEYTVWIGEGEDNEEIIKKLLPIIVKHMRLIHEIKEVSGRTVRITYLDFDYSEMMSAIPSKYELI